MIQDLQKLAEVLVNYSIGVKRGQFVRIRGPAVAEPLAVEIFREVVRAGGHPMVADGVGGDFAEIFFKTATDEQLAYLNPIWPNSKSKPSTARSESGRTKTPRR